ncbi:winged helix-turn-helix transcriptional regulator [Methanophagales archaeon]|nr:MAG: winged helix-turn-helix transcriptional regulator [Methanophagales archaeon]
MYIYQKCIKRDKDRCILRTLIENGRLSYSEVGRRCGISRQGAFERVQKLCSEGIIKGNKAYRCMGLDLF